MSLIDDLLEKYGLKYDDLDSPGHSGEREYLNNLLKLSEGGQLSLEKIKENLVLMRESVERELIDEPEFNYIFIFKVPNRKQIFLKARLRNYLLLEALLSSPERARKMMEDSIAGMAKKVI